ncbi:MAG: hypothetical protein OXF68_13090 [Gammaproteobacteria bacterium]|nr:hypothetical protein [Gammaproteobacteria bacterium]
MAALGGGWLIVALLASANGNAASLGDLVVVSRAGERLDGRIALVGAQGLQPYDIAVILGSEEDFGNLGLERFAYLETLRFAVEPPHVLVSSDAPIADAYLNFLVRLTWPDGTLLREYAVLLAAPGPAPVKPQAPVADSRPRQPPAVPAERTVTGQPSAVLAERSVTVQPRETLWSIAAARLPEGISVQQQMLTILRANPHAFVANNINGLVAGAVLRLPNDVNAVGLSPQEAINETGRQNDAWGAVGGGQLRIIDPAEQGPATEAVTERPTAEAAAESPPQAVAVGVPPPEPPLADLLREARRQAREQAGQLRRRDAEIARLSNELAALQAARAQERRNWMEELGRWRIAALAGLLPTAALIAVGLVALRRRRGARRADAPGRGSGKQAALSADAAKPADAADAPDYDFGAPIEDARVKLNLAQAHIDRGDRDSARELLEEVVGRGRDDERNEAQALLKQLAEGPSPPDRS